MHHNFILFTHNPLEISHAHIRLLAFLSWNYSKLSQSPKTESFGITEGHFYRLDVLPITLSNSNKAMEGRALKKNHFKNHKLSGKETNSSEPLKVK